jgi:hypothetical protein
MNRQFAFLCMFTASVVLGCASSGGEVRSEVPPQAASDSVYAETLEKWHRSDSVYSLFQKKIQVHGVLLTTDFRKAYLERVSRIRGDAVNALDESVGRRLGVFVSLTTPDYAYENLDDKRLWSVSLRYGKTQIHAPDVRPLSEKTPLTPFFPFVNQWSREFLVTFDANSTGELPDSVLLSLKSALVAVDLEWR